MNGVQNRKVHNNEKSFPGCLGRMVNLFDLTPGVTGNKLLTDKPHRDASTLSRSQSNLSRMSSPPYANQIDDKTVHQSTPMKMLIDEEMSREVHLNHNSPTVVAKLMGLDTFPGKQRTSTVFRSNSSNYSGRYGLVDPPSQYWQQPNGLVEKGSILDDISRCSEHDNCRDIYETWQQSPSSSNVRNKSPKKGSYSGNVNKSKMDLVRQKFDEAKHLSTNGKLRQSKEFEDALEVLSSNQDLLLEILQESNPIFYQNLLDLKSTAHAEKKRITVLRPTKVVDNEKSSRSGKNYFQRMGKADCTNSAGTWNINELSFSPTNQKLDEVPVQPTRIVVLKPSPNRTPDLRTVDSRLPPSPGILPTVDISDELEGGCVLEPQKDAKEITWEVHRNLLGNGTEETLHSSMFSSGYIDDASSFEKSETEYQVGNLKDLELTSLSPRHSWDYVNRYGSPGSSSSFSHASCSPDSSVCREAKKRLSERWTLMASNGSSQEKRLGRRSSSTLGEMLALSDSKKPNISEDGSTIKDEGSGESISGASGNINECGSLKGLPRSKSLPLSSNTCGSRLDVHISNHEMGKTQDHKELTEARSRKSSLKEKVSSLFFSRNKKSNNENARASQSNNESPLGVETPASVANVPGAVISLDKGLKESSVGSGQNPLDMNYQMGIVPCQQRGLSVSKPVMTISSLNQDQPSPISVLDTPFEEDENATLDSLKPHQLGPSRLNKSNLIDKSPPIGSIAQTLSWESSHAEVATPYPVMPSTAPIDIMEDKDDLLACVYDLLSLAGVYEHISPDLLFCRWHSPESALDPSLRDKFATINGKEPHQEAKRRQNRSKKKLVFDCVNAAIEEITGYGSEKHPTSRTYSGGANIRSHGVATCTLVDLIVERMKELLSSECSCSLENHDGDSHCLVESAVRKEVVGRRWFDLMRLEMDIFGKEMEGKLLEELVKEAVDDLIRTV